MTLNLRVDNAAVFNQELLQSGTTLVPPSQANCCAMLLAVRVRVSESHTSVWRC